MCDKFRTVLSYYMSTSPDQSSDESHKVMRLIGLEQGDEKTSNSDSKATNDEFIILFWPEHTRIIESLL